MTPFRRGLGEAILVVILAGAIDGVHGTASAAPVTRSALRTSEAQSQSASSQRRGIGYSTYLGGSGSDVVEDLLVRGDGAVYVAGSLTSLDFLNDGPLPRSAGRDGFVLLISADGQEILSWAVIGGSGDSDAVLAIGLADETLYAVGTTNSVDFPTTGDAYQDELRGVSAGFVVGLDPENLALTYSTLVGGSGQDLVQEIGVGLGGEIVLAGFSRSPDLFESYAGTMGCVADGDVFLLNLSPAVGGAGYGFCLGGSGEDSSRDLVFSHDSERVTLVGITESADFPVLGGLQQQYGGGSTDGFVTVVDNHDGEVLYSSFLGGNSREQIWGVALRAEAIYLAGSSSSPDFPLTRGFEVDWVGSNSFVSKFALRDGIPTSLAFSRFLGGPAFSLGGVATDLALDVDGDVVVVGLTNSPDFPLRDPVQPRYLGSGDAFVTVLDGDSGQIAFSTFLGGSMIDSSRAVAVGERTIYVAGATASADFPAVAPIQGRSFGRDAFVTRIAEEAAPTSCLFVSGGNGGAVTVLDASRRQSVAVLGEASIERGVAAVAITPSGDRAFVLERDLPLIPSGGVRGLGGFEPAVSVFDTRTGQQIGRFGAFATPRDIMLRADRGLVYVVDGDGVTALDSETGEVVETISVSIATRIVLDPSSSDRAFLIAQNGTRIEVLDLDTLAMVDGFDLGPGSRVSGVAAIPDTGLLAVVQRSQGQLRILDAEDGTLGWSIEIDSSPGGIAIAPDGRLAFIGHSLLGTGAVTVVDLETREVDAKLPLSIGVVDVAVTPDGAFLYVSSGLAEQVWVLDIETRSIVAVLSLGRPADRMAFGQSTNGCIVVPVCDGDCDGDGSVSIGELFTAVGVSLGTLDPSRCGVLDPEESVTVDYLVGSVRNALDGCPDR